MEMAPQQLPQATRLPEDFANNIVSFKRQPEAMNNMVPFQRPENKIQTAIEEMKTEQLESLLGSLTQNSTQGNNSKNEMIQRIQEELAVRPFIALIEGIVKNPPTNAFEAIQKLNELDQIAQNPNFPSKAFTILETKKAELLDTLVKFDNPQGLETTGSILTFPPSKSDLGRRIANMSDRLGVTAVDTEGKAHIFWHGNKGVGEFGESITKVNIDGVEISLTPSSAAMYLMKKRLGIPPNQEVTVHTCYGGNAAEEFSTQNEPTKDQVLGAKNDKTAVVTYTDPTTDLTYLAMGVPKMTENIQQQPARIPVAV